MTEVTVRYRAHIEHLPTGSKAVYEGVSAPMDNWGDCIHSIKWMWTEGNYGCDCNRHLFFERSLPEGEQSPIPDDEEETCGETKFRVTHVETECGIIILIDSERK